MTEIASAERSQKRSPQTTLRLCHLTTFWPNRLGVTHYVDHLIDGMRTRYGDQHLVAAEGQSKTQERAAYRALACWDRKGDYVESIIDGVLALDANLVLIQYTNDVFGDDDRIVRLLARLRGLGIKSALLIHSVYHAHRRTAFLPKKDAQSLDRALAKWADTLIVHTDIMREDLIARGITGDKIAVIPHGTQAITPVSQASSRQELGLPPRSKTIVFFGFIWLGKGLGFLLSVFEDVLRTHPETQLYIAGHTRHNTLLSRSYLKYLNTRIRWTGMHNNIRFYGDYVPDSVVPLAFSAADLVVFPYLQNYSSVSGVVHQAIGMQRLPLCADIAKFSEIARISPSLVVEARNRSAWAHRIIELLYDQALRDRLLASIARFAAETSWAEVGRAHLELYRRLLSHPAPTKPQAS